MKEIKEIKNIKLGEEIKIDRVVTETTSRKEMSEANANFKFVNLNENRSKLTTNYGKIINSEGLNMGSTPQDAEEYSQLVCEHLGVKKINHTTVEYCVDIAVNFKIRGCNNVFNTFSKMCGLKNLKDTYVSYSNNGKEKTIAKQIINNTKGVKAKGSHFSLKLYSKLEEKGIADLYEEDIVRFELIYHSKKLRQKKIKSLDQIEKVRKDMIQFLNLWSSLLPTSTNRHTKKTKEIIQKLSAKIKQK